MGQMLDLLKGGFLPLFLIRSLRGRAVTEGRERERGSEGKSDGRKKGWSVG